MKKFLVTLTCLLLGVSAFAQYTNTPGVANYVDQVLSLSLYEDGSGNRGIGLYVLGASGTWPNTPAVGYSDNQIYSQAYYKDSNGKGALGVFLIGGGGILPTGTTDNAILTWDNTGGSWVQEGGLTVDGGDAVLTGDIEFGGSFTAQVVTKTSGEFPYTAATEMYILANDAGAGAAVTVNLPAASGVTGRVYEIKKIGNSQNVIVDANGAETIDGQATKTLTVQYEAVTVVCDGTAWHIF